MKKSIVLQGTFNLLSPYYHKIILIMYKVVWKI